MLPAAFSASFRLFVVSWAIRILFPQWTELMASPRLVKLQMTFGHFSFILRSSRRQPPLIRIAIPLPVQSPAIIIPLRSPSAALCLSPSCCSICLWLENLDMFGTEALQSWPYALPTPLLLWAAGLTLSEPSAKSTLLTTTTTTTGIDARRAALAALAACDILQAKICRTSPGEGQRQSQTDRRREIRKGDGWTVA